MIQLTGIHKSYQVGEARLQVLTNIHLQVRAGEFVAILGASGSGKSTLMNIIGCMDTFDSGAYAFQGEAVAEKSANELAFLRNHKIGFIFQKYHLIPQYNVLQNMMMPLLIRGMKKGDALAIAREKAKAVGLCDRLAHRPQALSGGQQQRVAIARALVTAPALLLADEPTGALDSTTGQEILGLFAQLHQEGHTILMITHDGAVAAHAQRTIKLCDGQSVSDAQPLLHR